MKTELSHIIFFPNLHEIWGYQIKHRIGVAKVLRRMDKELLKAQLLRVNRLQYYFEKATTPRTLHTPTPQLRPPPSWTSEG